MSNSHERQPPAAQGENDKEDNPHLVVAGPEITDVRRVEVAHLGAAFLLCVAGGRVLVCVFPGLMHAKKRAACCRGRNCACVRSKRRVSPRSTGHTPHTVSQAPTARTTPCARNDRLNNHAHANCVYGMRDRINSYVHSVARAMLFSRRAKLLS